MNRMIAMLGALLLLAVAPAAWQASAADCPAGMSVDLSVAIDTGPVRVGETIPVNWELHGQLAPSNPAYLVVSTSAIVRFDGTGFYALAPGASGPFGLEFGSQRTRAIVPLHTPFSEQAGSIGVIPYEAAQVALEWGVFDAQGCDLLGNPDSASAAIDALPGRPVLLPRDEFSAAHPEMTFMARNAPFQVSQYSGFVEVTNTATGETILRTAGSLPHFSPTGRFLDALADENGYIDVFDLIAERKLGRFEGYQTYWSHADSFLYLDRDYDGRMEIVRTLHGRRLDFNETIGADVLAFFENDDGGTPGTPDGLDIDPGAGWGSFVAGWEAWAFQLSLESGTVAFAKVAWKNVDGASIVEEDDDDGLIMDLGARAERIIAHDGAELDAILVSRFGVESPSVEKWNVGEPLLSPVEQEESHELIDMDAEPRMGEFYFSQNLVDVKPTVVTAADPSQIRMRGATALTAPAGSEAISTVAGARFDHLGQFAPPALRSTENDAQLRQIEAELGSLYSPAVARFGREYNFPYQTYAFPDPAVLPPDGEPPLVDMIRPGRDTWVWDQGGDRFWLTQTVASTRLAHEFSFTLLRRKPDGSLSHADLLPIADAYSVRSLGNPPGEFRLVNFGDARSELGSTFGSATGVSIAGGRYLLLATRPLPRLIVFDLAEWKVQCAIATVNGSDIASVSLHADLHHLTQVNRNGVAEVYDCNDGKRVLSGLYVDGELVVVDDQGFFDGSDDAAAYVEMKIPGIAGRHFLSQFASTLRVEGLAEKVLAGRRVARDAPLFSPPVLKLRQEGGSLIASATSATGLSGIEVYSGGRLVRRDQLEGNRGELRLPLNELGAGGIATVAAIDRDGLRSAPVELLVPEKNLQSPRRLFGLAVGIDRYSKIAGGDLNFAAADARRMGRLLGNSRYYDNADFTVLSDAEATHLSILSNLTRIVSAAGEDDTIVISFAGHGLSEDGRLRLALTDTDLTDVASTSLDMQQVIDAIKPARARVLVLLDVCHAGLAGRADIATNTEAASALTTENGAGMVILSASKGRQFSEESADGKGGRFSVAMEQALGTWRRQTDADDNGRISVSELYRAVKARVVAATSGRQTPWLARNRLVGDFDLF